MQQHIKTIEELAGELDFKLQDGAVITTADKERLVSLLTHCISLVEDMNENTQYGLISSMDKAAGRMLQQEFPNKTATELAHIYKNLKR